MRIYTIGFTKKSAEKFIGILKKPGAVRVVDVRLKNESQLAGFSKKDDLKYFLREICRMDNVRVPDLAPTQEILDEYRGTKTRWDKFEKKINHLLEQRCGSRVLCSPGTFFSIFRSSKRTLRS